jgi:hypothetical protein
MEVGLSPEEYRLRVFENRVLRRIFKFKGEDVTRDWRKLMRSIILSLNIIRTSKLRRMSWMGHIADMEDVRNGYKISI